MRTGRHRVHARLLAALCAVALASCGDSNDGSSGGGSPTGPSGGGPGPSGATITVANGAATPTEVRINVGQSVTFVNNDSRPREMSSDPHPVHTDCPAINASTPLQPGQSRVTNAFTAARTCGFHDHLDPDNPAVRGRIVIQ